MILQYYPMNKEATYDFIWDECGYRDPISVEEIIYDLVDDGFCKYINKKGKSEGHMCLKKIRKNTEKNEVYCHFHRYRNKICTANGCNSKCQKNYNRCKKHMKYWTSIQLINETCDHGEKYVTFDTIYYYPIVNIYGIIRNINALQEINVSSSDNGVLIKNVHFSINKFLYEIFNKFKELLLKIIKKYSKDHIVGSKSDLNNNCKYKYGSTKLQKNNDGFNIYNYYVNNFKQHTIKNLKKKYAIVDTIDFSDQVINILQDDNARMCENKKKIKRNT